ncbi:BMP family lipoprotein [Haloferax denitrificans]|uniref:Putative sugar ABC transporter periplasmic substrate-binding protein n=1 Tax=Haloferax denitrificans ATCC 35960 TaxID=662478 RepID=M0JIZ7_9EURY|nr:BMP family protein [Haloferax denitrificans]EMA08333.1 putative sugar ABC transporter periplasmic substrate-binding protein [Haloferax denitrificans ATCC 35960]
MATRDTGAGDSAGETGTQETRRGVERRDVLKSGLSLAAIAGVAGCLSGGDSEETTTTAADDGGGDDSETSGETTESGGSGGETTNVAIVSSPAGFGDQAFNDLALQGLQTAAEEYDIEIQQVEETNQSNYQTVQSRLAESTNPDYDLVVLVSYNHTQALQTNAEAYPDQNWMLINDSVDQPNVAGYTWANHQMSFQAGVLAGTMTTRELSYEGNSLDPDSSTVGFVGGVDGSLINAFERSYRAGVEWVDENVDVRVGYIGNYTDTQTANNIATSQYDAGADIVYHAAAAAGQGVFQAAQDANRFAIGVDADQSVTLPEYEDVIMGSAVKYINEGTYEVAEATVQDNWSAVQGANILGLEEDAVRVVLGQAVGGELPDVVTENLEAAREAIINGDVTVPCSASGC